MNNDRDVHPMEPAWEPCGPRCGCNRLTSVCWGPVDAPREVEIPDDVRARIVELLG